MKRENVGVCVSNEAFLSQKSFGSSYVALTTCEVFQHHLSVPHSDIIIHVSVSLLDYLGCKVGWSSKT